MANDYITGITSGGGGANFHIVLVANTILNIPFKLHKMLVSNSTAGVGSNVNFNLAVI